MKKILIIMALFIAGINPVFAGEGRDHDTAQWEEGRDARMKERMDRLAKDLELSADQKIKFDKILKEHGDQFKELAEKTQEKKKELKEKVNEQLKDKLKGLFGQ